MLHRSGVVIIREAMVYKLFGLGVSVAATTTTVKSKRVSVCQLVENLVVVINLLHKCTRASRRHHWRRRRWWRRKTSRRPVVITDIIAKLIELLQRLLLVGHSLALISDAMTGLEYWRWYVNNSRWN